MEILIDIGIFCIGTFAGFVLACIAAASKEMINGNSRSG